MKKIVAITLSLTILSGIFQNTSSAEKVSFGENIQEKNFNLLTPDRKKCSSNNPGNLNEKEAIMSKSTTAPINISISKNNINKKSIKDKSIENIKNNLEKYIKKQQISIQKYENMSNKEFVLKKIRKIFIKTLFSFLLIFCGLYGINKVYSIGREEALSYVFDLFDKYMDPDTVLKNLDPNITLKYLNTRNRLKVNAKELVKKILKTLHPDNFKRIKTFDDIKDLYYSMNNFYDDYLK